MIGQFPTEHRCQEFFKESVASCVHCSGKSLNELVEIKEINYTERFSEHFN